MADKKSKSSNSEHKGAEPEASQSQGNSFTLDIKKDFKRWKNRKFLAKVLVITFSVLTIITAIVAVGLIVVSMMSAIAASALDTLDTSGRLLALIVLAITAAITVAIIVYAQLATCSKKKRPIHVAVVVLSILAALQLIIAQGSVQVTGKSQVQITQGLAESFEFTKQHSPRHVKMWTSMQHSLKCCGLYSPYDYRAPNSPAYLPPDVPISCCPNYDPKRSDLVQERDREVCKARTEYFEVGCSSPVLEVITDTSLWAYVVAIVLVILEFLSAIVGAFVIRKRKRLARLQADSSDQKTDPEANDK